VRGWQGVKQSLKEHANRFPLIGGHAVVECETCHKSAAVGQFRGLSTDCGSCHIADFLNAKLINHQAARFPTTCQNCHGMDNWVLRFNHDGVTGFALTGAHKNAQCQACHVGGQYTALSTTCASCHLMQFSNTRNPNHVAARFSQECSACHTTTAWTPAAFNHGQTNYPLTGAHTSAPCSSCHVGDRFAGTPTDCFSCHSNDYSGVTDPNHIAAGLSRDCALCHTNSTWNGAIFNHVNFPIYSGKHKDKWTACSNCHINSSSYGVYSCITCHEHEQSVMDPKHRSVPGYVYTSTICYACHPIGQKN